jgi:3-hydroxy-9,10-secoandrosta-1,3,5(10)-triene-9,17-dione monooxygenase reductase component
VCDDHGVTTALDPQSLRRLMSHWATGVAVVTSRDGNGPRGATTNALTSLSLDPLLVLVALDRASNTLAAVRNAGRFCINVLAADQEEIARRFATKASGEEKLAGCAHELVDGVPVLGGCVAWLACELDREVDGGDHAILLGRPLEAGADSEKQPLVFFGGRYHPARF